MEQPTSPRTQFLTCTESMPTNIAIIRNKRVVNMWSRIVNVGISSLESGSPDVLDIFDTSDIWEACFFDSSQDQDENNCVDIMSLDVDEPSLVLPVYEMDNLFNDSDWDPSFSQGSSHDLDLGL